MKVVNTTKQAVLAENASFANTLKTRMKGLLGKDGLNQGEGLVITRCNSIHTFFMKFSIDVIFVNKNDRVIKVLHRLKPWRLCRPYLGASCCIELPSGVASKTNTQIGDTISFQ